LWTNSKTIVRNYGSSIALNYNFYRSFSFNINASYAKLRNTANNDGFEEAFNTPRWIMNIGLGHSQLSKNFGFGLSYKYQEGFLWQSALASGNVREIHNIDAQFTYNVRNQGLQFKLAGTNILNRPYVSFIAGPTVGAFYYLTITADIERK